MWKSLPSDAFDVQGLYVTATVNSIMIPTAKVLDHFTYDHPIRLLAPLSFLTSFCYKASPGD